MISSITFETAALADAIKKANKLAPLKGAAFDKAAGIVMEFDPASAVPLAVIRSTNLEISSMEWVNVLDWEGEPARWRLPSFLMAHVVSSLPIGTGKGVKLFSELNGQREIIHLHSGRTKVKFHPISMEYYPQWGAFDPDSMFPAEDLGGRIDQVEWACSNQFVEMSGVYLDGTSAIATDRFRMARVPLSIPDLPNPIVIPSGFLGQLLRARGEIQIGSDGHQLHIMPDETTQIRAVILDVKFPPVYKVMERPFTHQLEISRDELIASMQRVSAFAQGDRVAAFSVIIGKEQLALYLKADGIGDIGDVVEIPGHADHERFTIKFTPKNIMEPLTKSPNNKITIHYNLGQARGMIKIDDGAGFEAWVMSRGTE